MTYTFESCFAARIEDFIAQKNALGFGYLESSRLLRDFDRFCMTHFPEENFLTEELCLAWATKKNTEGNNTFRNRMMQTVSDDPLFFLINGYTTGFQASVLSNMLMKCVSSRHGGIIDAQELCLPVTTGGVLPCGASGRWSAK